MEYGFAFGGRAIDIFAVVTERYQRRLRVFTIAADGSGLSDLGAVPVLEGQAGEGGAPMGIGLYRRPRDGAVFAIVAPKTGPADGYLWQYRLHDARRRASFAGVVVAVGPLGGTGEIEAVAVDDDAGHVYYADEDNGVHQWHADPDREDASTELAHFAREGFSGDREGLAIYGGRGGDGWIIATDQLPVNSGYHLYRRNATQGSTSDHPAVRVFSGGADSTDGIEATSRDLGPEFPGGLFVAMNSSARNFLFYRWKDIQAAIDGRREEVADSGAAVAQRDLRTPATMQACTGVSPVPITSSDRRSPSTRKTDEVVGIQRRGVARSHQMLDADVLRRTGGDIGAQVGLADIGGARCSPAPGDTVSIR